MSIQGRIKKLVTEKGKRTTVEVKELMNIGGVGPNILTKVGPLVQQKYSKLLQFSDLKSLK